MSLFRLAKLIYILWLGFCNLSHLYADYVDAATPTDILPPGFKLVFSDEFNGKTIDHSKWNLGINEEKYSKYWGGLCLLLEEYFTSKRMVSSSANL